MVACGDWLGRHTKEKNEPGSGSSLKLIIASQRIIQEELYDTIAI
jgi:hypothetical protein